MRYSTLFSAAALLCCLGCGEDADYEKEIILQLFKPQGLDVGAVYLNASQGAKQGSSTVNTDGQFFSSCDANKVRIIPGGGNGVYPQVTVTITVEKLPALALKVVEQISVSATNKTTLEKIVLTKAVLLEPDGPCKPGTTPVLKETGDGCGKAADCEGGVCLKEQHDGSNKHVFHGGYCTRDCKGDKTKCKAGTEWCEDFEDGFGTVTHSYCLKKCGSLNDCRKNEDYECTPVGKICFPKTI